MSQFSFDRLVRKVFPSLSRLTFNSLFKFLVDASDIPARMVFPEFRRLPPNHMRIRVGVGNRLFNNQPNYLLGWQSFWIDMFRSGRINLNSTIIDIGSGCGRTAHVLRDYSSIGGTFSGTYVGIDIDEEMVAWCNSHFDPQRFSFRVSTDGSKSYDKGPQSKEPYRIPEAGGIADLVFSLSLFTHLLEPEMRNYLKESYRLLRPGGTIFHACFCLDYPPPTLGSRHTFKHRIGNASVESLVQPEAAVAYSEAFLLGVANEIGFVEAEINHQKGGVQAILVARKPAAP